MAARALEMSGMADASSYVPPVPNGQEVMQADLVRLANEVAPASRIEGPGYSSPLPRNPAPRDYMQMPGRGAR